MSQTGMNFDSLVIDLQNYVERGDPGDATVVRQIPRIINNAERSLADRLKIQGYRDVLTGTLSAQNPTLAKPQGWRNTVSINIGTGASNNTRNTLRFRGYELLRAYYPDDTAVGVPIFYADYDFDHWLLAPVPDFAYPFESTVYLLPPLLSENNQQNYLTQFTPNLLLYECLKALEPFIRNDVRMAMWKSMADEELSSINTQELQKVVDRGLIRTSA